jgi:hypothetical protein
MFEEKKARAAVAHAERAALVERKARVSFADTRFGVERIYVAGASRGRRRSQRRIRLVGEKKTACILRPTELVWKGVGGWLSERR